MFSTANEMFHMFINRVVGTGKSVVVREKQAHPYGKKGASVRE